MRKRKTTFELIERSEERLLDQGGSQSKPPTTGHSAAETNPSGQPVRGQFPVSHTVPKLATCTEVESPVAATNRQVEPLGSEVPLLEEVAGHVNPTRGPAGQVEELVVLVAEGDNPAVQWFWQLLREAGYDVW